MDAAEDKPAEFRNRFWISWIQNLIQEQGVAPLNIALLTHLLLPEITN